MSSFSDHLQEALGPDYQLEGELTGGGMSRVFVALHRSLGRKVVVKVLPPELAAGVNRERFRREVQVAAQLHHPHIVPLLSAGEHGDLLWYTMPFIEGESLKASVERGYKFSVREVIRILHDVVDALDFAHARGLIHRDIKPANVLRQGSHALVVDFGVAKAINAALPITTATAAGIAIGTPAYMAPEQLAGDPNADHRIDLYAAGLLAYELFTGNSPFTGPSPRETMAAQLTRDPEPLHDVNPAVPLTLSTLIMRCLAKDPKQRPATAHDVLEELDSLTMPIGVTPASGGMKARPAARRRGPVVAGVLAVVVLVAATIGLIAQRQRGTPTAALLPPSGVAASAGRPDSARAATAAPAVVPQAAAAAPTPPPRPIMTHADSVAIAAAVERRIAAARARDSVQKAKIAEETERRMTDSIIAANSGGAGAAGRIAPRRVAVVEPRDNRLWPEASLLGRAVADSLRRMLSRHGGLYLVVNQDSVRAAATNFHTADAMGPMLATELIAAIHLNPMRNDSALMDIQIYDLGADQRFRVRAAATPPMPRQQILANLDQLLLQTVTTMDEISRAPRAR